MPVRNIFIDKNKENIIKDYMCGLSLQDVSKKYNTSYDVIRTRLRCWGIERHTTNYKRTLNITKEVLEDLRIVKKFSYDEIAKQFACSTGTIKNYAKKYGLTTPYNSGWSKKYNKCRGCGTTTLRHRKDGYCVNCARKLGLIVYKWPKQYSEGCVVCGMKTSSHKKDGLCSKCWNKEFYKDSNLQRKIKYTWSIEYPCCTLCGTTKQRHVSSGLCSICYARKNNNNIKFKTCPVCVEKYVQIFRHWRQEIIKNKDKEHTKYLKGLVKKYFNSTLSLEKIADKLETNRHNVTKWFTYFFGKEKTKDRNESVRCFIISSKAAKNFPYGPTVQHPKYVDNLGRNFKFRSKLEHIFAKWLDKNEVVWEYENKTFPYTTVEGKIRHYTPDFYFPEFNFYIELKGRVFKNTEYKIKQTEKEHNIKIYILWQKEVVCRRILKEIE